MATLIVRALALSTLLAAPAALALECPDTDPEALTWLDRMSRSASDISYQGVVTYERGGRMQVMQVSHAVADGAESESLTRLTGQGERVTRSGHPLHCVHPGQALLRLAAEGGLADCGIAIHYRLKVQEGERIAGRETVTLQVQPRDMYRYGYVLSLERDTGLLLRSQTVGRGGVALERFQFASVQLGTAGSTNSGVRELQAAHVMPPGLDAAVQVSSWRPQWVPRGFVYTDPPAASDVRRTFTDGLAVFSVFLERLTQQLTPGEGVVREGSTLSYTRGMALHGESVLVTVVGEVPVNTARMVADSVAWTR